MKKFIYRIFMVMFILAMLALGMICFSVYALNTDVRHNEFSKTKIVLKFLPYTKYDGIILWMLIGTGVNADMVRYFVEKRGFDVNTDIYNDGTSLLDIISRYNWQSGDGWYSRFGIKTAEDFQNRMVPRYLEAMDYLLSKGATIDGIEFNGKTMYVPLMEAAVSDNFERVKFLVNRGADINKISEFYHLSPITAAGTEGHFEIVKYLLECGAKLNDDTAGKDVLSVLTFTIIGGNFEIVKFLVENGADVNVGGTGQFERMKPLLVAIGTGNLEAVQYLVNHGADIHYIHPNTGVDYLMFAASIGKANIEIVKYLVGQGLDVNAVNKEGKTALQLAEEAGKTEIADYLRNLTKA